MALSSTNGYLDGNGESPYAAHADHNHNADYAAKTHNHDSAYASKGDVYPVDTGYAPMQVKVATIATTDWSEDAATVAISGTFVGAFCLDSTISVSSAGEGSVTFAASDTPAADVVVNIFTIPTSYNA